MRSLCRKDTISHMGNAAGYADYLLLQTDVDGEALLLPDVDHLTDLPAQLLDRGRRVHLEQQAVVGHERDRDQDRLAVLRRLESKSKQGPVA